MKHPVLAVLNFYGAVNFSDPHWSSELPPLAAKFPGEFTPEFLNKVYDEKPVPIKGGVSLEGQAGPPRPSKDDPRMPFAMTQIAHGKVLNVIFPSMDLKRIDPVLNVTSAFPPTFTVHGDADWMVPIGMSEALFKRLKEAGVESEMLVVPGEPHTFAGTMKKGSQTWNLQRRGFDWLQGIIERQ